MTNGHSSPQILPANQAAMKSDCLSSNFDIIVIEPPYNAVCKPTPINTILAGVTPSFLLKLKIKIINAVAIPPSILINGST
ncbi:Uncharacterised protein [Staphylococcus aureus]|nr:Uncharacterised protein [Staphylococcus aureus]